MPADSLELPGFMVAFIAVFAVLFAGTVVFIIVSGVRNYRAAKRAGLDPLAAQTQIAGRIYNSDALAPGRPSADLPADRRPAAERLAELDGLKVRGLVTEPEYQEARRRILGTL